jgi:uncharacterized membrane protein|tara:strand:- start:2500 stop:2865 length:366 start_codon:yes stop_codon:yes gene_type:complete
MDYIIALITLLCLDAIYFSVVGSYFSSMIKTIQKESLQIKPISFIITYLLMLFGLYTIILSKKRSPYEAFILGLLVYGVFELTNYTIFRKWSLLPVIFETIWGGVLFCTTTWITYYISKHI